MNPDIIVINFEYSNSKVGGNRWRHLIPLLNRHFKSVKVLCQKADNPVKKMHLHTQTFSFNHGILHLNRLKKMPFHGIIYRIIHLYSKFINDGNYYDLSGFVGNKISKWIGQGLKNGDIKSDAIIICSIGPFHYIGNIINLKLKYPTLKIILDYRDPWSTNSLSFGIKHLTSRRKKKESQNEINALKFCDGIIGVSEEVYFPLLNNLGLNKPNLEVANGVNFFNRSTKNEKSNKIRVFFAGTLYEDLDDLFLPWLDQLEQLNKDCKELSNLFEWHWFGSFPQNILEIIKLKTNHQSFFYDKLNQTELIAKISKLDLSINFIHRDFTYSKNTKFYEALELGKKIFLISWNGKTVQYIQEKRIGYAWNVQLSLKEIMKEIVTDWNNGKLPIKEPQFKELESLTYKHQCEKLIQFIEKVSHA